MENIITTVSYLKNFLFLFPCEILCLAGVMLNSFIYFLPIKKFKIKKISDFFLTTLLIINSFMLPYLYFNGFNNTNTIIKLLVNIFILFYVFATYKLTSRCRYRGIILNSILLSLMLLSFLIIDSQNYFITYILLEIVIFNVFRYGNIAQLRKKQTNSYNFILISSISSLLFLLFFTSTFFINKPLQLCIIQICMGCALLLKIGIFPIYNYSLSSQNKSDIPSTILLFCYTPLICSVAFLKIIQNFYLNNEIFKLTILCFLVISAISFGFSALKQKNLIKFLTQTCYFYASFAIINMLLHPESTIGIKLILLYSFCALGIFSLVSIIKLNSNKQINTNLIKGLYYSNKPLSYFLSAALLIYFNIIPSILLYFNVKALKYMYLLNYGFYLGFIFIMLNVLILLNVINIIQNIYCVNFKPVTTFKKATTLNYVAAFMILFTLLILCYL